MTENITDEILIRQALAGRQSAYSILVKRYEKYVFTLALRFVRDREDAHEVAQDSFLRVFRYLADFRGDCKFTTWMYKIVYSTAMNHLRKNNPDFISLDDQENPVRLKDTSVPDASFSLESSEKSATLQQAIALLSPDDAGIITLFYLYEQSLDEICVIMELSLTNAKTKLCRARQRLKAVIENSYAELRNH